MQIYVPWNCVLVHEGQCHRMAQWEKNGELACLKDVSVYYPHTVILGWLVNLSKYFHVAREKIPWLEEHGDFDSIARAHPDDSLSSH